MSELVLTCGTPILAVFIIIGLFIFMGFLIDFDGMMDWYKEWENRIKSWIEE